ncbi:MAG: hypothetical protein Q9209_007295 [Squamulea sp. 1 TL-2023]
MSLKRRICRFAATYPSDHIWISDDILNHALSRYMQLRVDRRHGSAIPGPLEARKRATKRRMAGLADTTGGLDLHPGFLTGLGRGQENQQGWQWQSPTLPHSKDPPGLLGGDNGSAPSGQLGTIPAENSTLPAWLTDYDHKDDTSGAEEDSAHEPVNRLQIKKAVSDGLEAKIRKHRSPEDRLKDDTDLDKMRRVMRNIKEHDPRRKSCSRLALCQLLEVGCDVDKILDFWVDPLLNPWAARNLSFFVAYCVAHSMYEEMKRFCEWTVRQFYIGACEDRNITLLITELSKSRERNTWQEILVSLCEGLAQALHSSPVLRVEDLEFETYSSLLAILSDDDFPLLPLELELNSVKRSKSVQLLSPTGLVWPTVERWLCTWEPSRSADLSPMILSSTITTLLLKVPQHELPEIVKDVSRRVLNLSLSETDPHITWQRQSIWWSAIQAPEVFQHIKKSVIWSEISDALRRRQEEVIKLMAVVKINKQLNQNNLKAAYRTFWQCPQVTLESCPRLAEALISDPDRDWRLAIIIRETRQATVLVDQDSAGDEQSANHLQDEQRRLLERMALAYAQQEHTPVSVTMIFYYVYGCWKIYERDKLGPMRPAMTRALTLAGIVRPLQARRQVSRLRLEWILRVVAEVEGSDAARKLGATVCEWLDEGYQQSRYGRHRELLQSLSERHREQNIRVQEMGVWDGLTTMAQAQPDAPSRYKSSARFSYQASPVLDMYSASTAYSATGPSRERTRDNVATQSPFKSTSLFKDKDEEDDEGAQPAEETFISALASETTTVIESTNSNLLPVASQMTKQYVLPTESHPPPSSVEDLQYTQEHNARDASRNGYITARPREQALKAEYFSRDPPLNPAVDASVENVPPGFRSRYVHGTETREEASIRHYRQRKVYSLFLRLNDARFVNSGKSDPSTSGLHKLDAPELSSIPQCSLSLIAVNKNKIRRYRTRPLGFQHVDGATPFHGMKEYEGPTTLAGATASAFGRGLHLLWVQRILEKAEKATWRRSTNRSFAEGRY